MQENDGARRVVEKFYALILSSRIKDEQIKYLLQQLGGYVMPTQMNAIVDKLDKIAKDIEDAASRDKRDSS